MANSKEQQIIEALVKELEFASKNPNSRNEKIVAEYADDLLFAIKMQMKPEAVKEMEYTAKIGDLVWLKSVKVFYAAVITDVYVQKSTSTVNGIVSEHEHICVAINYCTGKRWVDTGFDGKACSCPASYFDGRFLDKPVFRLSTAPTLPDSKCIIISDHTELESWLSEKALA